MSNRPTNSGTSLLDHLALRYLRQALDTPHPTDEPYVLNPTESRIIRRVKWTTLVLAALLGVLGVLLLYLPQYNWPYLFATTKLTLLGTTYSLPLTTLLWGLLLVYVEVNVLIALNLLGVKAMMQACQFPRDHDAQYDRHLRALTNAALERSHRGMLRFGVDPYLNLPRWGLTIYFLLNMIKAALSNLAVKFTVRQWLGHLPIRQLTDLAGMPIYAAWNAYASWQVLREAQVRIMAPLTIREFVNELYDEWGCDEEFTPLILETLQYTGILNRQYNYAHFLLTETLVDRFGLQPDRALTGHFIGQAARATPAVQRSVERLIVFCALVDGQLSGFEKRRLRELRRAGLLRAYAPGDIRRIGNDYTAGRGLWV